MGKVFRLRPVKVLVASSDVRFRSVVSFLLGRRGFDVTTAAHARIGLDELVAQNGAALAVVDADTFPDRRAELSRLDVGVVTVGDAAEGAPRPDRHVLPKWGPVEDLVAEFERLLTILPTTSPRFVANPRQRTPREAAAGTIAGPGRPVA